MLATLTLAAALSAAQSARLDGVMRYVMHDRSIPKMSVGVVRDGEVTIHAYGGARATTVFPIGSLSKGILAATALRANIPLDKRVVRNVTLEALLTQTSGIPDYADEPGFDSSSRAIVAPRALVANVLNLPPHFAPGSDFEYSNSNYVLAGLAIEGATHEPLVVTEHRLIFTPLHMTATRRWLRSSLLFGAGDLESNAVDMTAWMRELLHPRVLARRSIDRMTGAARLNDGTPSPYGMGFFVTTVYGLRAATASGFVTGYSAYIALVPGKHTGVVLLANGNRVDLAPAAKSALAAALDIPE